MVTASLQKKSLELFNDFFNCPMPLVVNKWSAAASDNFKAITDRYFGDRAKSIMSPLFDINGIGVSIYYYPYIPDRVRFTKPAKSSYFTDRKKYFENWYAAHAPHGYSRSDAVTQLLENVTKLFLAGYVPFSFEDHGIGQCVAPQNVTMRGNLMDMGSIKAIDSLASDKEFAELYFCTLTVMVATLRELFCDSLNEIYFEFSDPTPSSILISHHIHQRLIQNLNRLSNDHAVSIDPRLDKFLQCYNSSDLENQLYRLFEGSSP
jgi:hypothetical protein